MTKKKPFELEMSSGIKLVLQDRIRTTELARFGESAKPLIDKIAELTGAGGSSLVITEGMAAMLIRGWPADVIEKIQVFLVKYIVRVDDGEGLDWIKLSEEERRDWVDFTMSMLDLMTVFIAAWMKYQGLSPQVRREGK